jgi:hypothetical protein
MNSVKLFSAYFHSENGEVQFGEKSCSRLMCVCAYVHACVFVHAQRQYIYLVNQILHKK